MRKRVYSRSVRGEYLPEPRIPEAAQLRADADVAQAIATERRFHAIEDGQRLDRLATEGRQNSILTAINGLTDTVNRQNSRVGKLEEWKGELDRVKAFASGVMEGRAGLRKGEIAALVVAIATVSPFVTWLVQRYVG